jgi:hypothetical protein
VLPVLCMSHTRLTSISILRMLDGFGEVLGTLTCQCSILLAEVALSTMPRRGHHSRV